MGLIRDVAGAAIGAAFPGGGEGASGGAGAPPKRRKSMRDDIPTDEDSSMPTPGSDDQKRPGYGKRFGQALASRYAKGISR